MYLIVCPQRIITHFQHHFFRRFKNESLFMFGFGAFEGFFFIGQNEARCWKKRICSVVTFNSAAATQKSIYLAFVESCESVALPSYTIQIIASFADDVLVHDVNPFILFYVRHTQSYCRWRRIYIHIYIRMLFFFRLLCHLMDCL